MMKFMKRNIFLLISILFIFTGCMDPVFFNIRKEVSLVSSTVHGSVNSIARYTFDGKEYLVTQNSNSVFYKLVETERIGDKSAWIARENSKFQGVKYDAIGKRDYNGEYIIKLAADTTNIYILTAVIGVDHEEGEARITGRKLYCTNSLVDSSWEQIDVPNIDLNKSSIFCTNSIKSENRKAYFRNGADLYELNGNAVLGSTITVAAVDGSSTVDSAIWFKGDVLFFGTIASGTNETSTDDATMYYYGSGAEICYSNADGSVSGKTDLKNSDKISCIAMANDYLLFGSGNPSSSTSTGGGIAKVSLVNGVPGSVKETFSTNADAALTSSYQLITLLSVYPEKNETENIIYASTNFKTSGSSISVSYDNLGLWAYYPTRGNWNRE